MKFALLIAVLFGMSLLHGEVPSLINYQGLLTDINGNVVSGTKSVSISIYNAASGGDELYSEAIGDVLIDSGLYSFQFGGGVNFATSLATGSQHWLQVTMDGVAQTPRERLVTVPFALRSKHAEVAETVVPQNETFFVAHLFMRSSSPIRPPSVLSKTWPSAEGGSTLRTEALYSVFPEAFDVLDTVTVKASGLRVGGYVRVRIVEKNMLTGATQNIYSFDRTDIFDTEETSTVGIPLDRASCVYWIELDVDTLASSVTTPDKTVNYIRLTGKQ